MSKDLCLKDAMKELKRLNNKLEFWKNEKNILFNNTQPKAVNTTKEIVDGGIRTNIIDNYVIDAEEINLEINILKEKIDNLIEYIGNEIKIIGNYDPLEQKIILLREEHKMKWEEIAKATNYSRRQAIRIYNKYFKQKK